MNWWQRLRHRDRLERQLDAELRDHLERLTADHVASGLDEREARREARLQFGGLDQMKEACRDENTMPFLNGATIQDFRFAVRRLFRMPGFTLSALVVLALGIGVNTAMFAIVHALVFAPPALSLWPDEDALGQHVEYAGDDAPRAEGGGGGGIGYSDDSGSKPGEVLQIVGIVPAARRGLFGRNPAGQIYVPFARGYQANLSYFVRFRSLERGSQAAAADMIRRIVHDADPALPILSLRTFDEHLADNPQIWFVRAAATMFSAFGGLAWGLAVVGLYGVRAYAVSRRTREIGVRMALGAGRRDISRMLLRESMPTIGGGIALGLLLAVVIAKGLSGLLYEIGPLDPISFITASLLLTAAALTATWLPASRATRIAPTIALRTD